MKYRKHGTTWIVRIDRGEELMASLSDFCKQTGVRFGAISGIGAADTAVIGLFDTGHKQFISSELTGDHEITSIIGTITEMNGEAYLHVHATLAGRDNRVIGGHLSRAIISGTCELVIQELPGGVDRLFDVETGLNLFDLD